jgi:hypothetical protein
MSRRGSHLASSGDPSYGYEGTSYGVGDGDLTRTGAEAAGVPDAGVGVVGLGLGSVLVSRRPWGHTG